MKLTKYYFLPFLDNLLAVLVSLLFTIFFGSWFGNAVFGFIMGIALTLVMCGFVYSRMWKLSRKNTRYDWGLPANTGIRCVLPLCIFSFVLILIFMLADHNILPLQDIVIKNYYTFPDNLPRELVSITPFDYLTVVTRFWFSYLLPFAKDPSAWLFCLSPVLAAVSAALGFKLGAENKEVLDGYVKVVNKAKDKFNE